MFGHSYFGSSYYADTYFGPNDGDGGAKKVYTDEDFKGMEAFERARQGQVSQEITEEIVSTDTLDRSILDEVVEVQEITKDSITQETFVIPISKDSQFKGELDKATQLDFGLIMAIWTAHNN